MRIITSRLLATASAAVCVGSLVTAWATFDFWETGPLLACVFGAGTLAGLALYVRRRSLPQAVAVGFVVALLTFVGAAFITLSRWEG
jgi:hypothetical protein